MLDWKNLAIYFYLIIDKLTINNWQLYGILFINEKRHLVMSFSILLLLN